MSVRLATRPRCINCGKPIAKFTATVFFGHGASSYAGGPRLLTDKPSSVAEAQKHTNHKIVSVRWYQHGTEARYIGRVSTWDGVSYVDPYFCNGTCCKAYAYAAARRGVRL